MKKPLINYSRLYDFAQDSYSLFSCNFLNGKSLLPLRYTLELTYRCNLNCGFCYVGEKIKENELSTEEWLNIIDKIPPFRLITFVGGEVLIRKDFKTILNAALQKGKVNIVTNGMLIDDELIETFVNKKLLLLNLSIDAMGEKHDKIRNQKGVFDKVIQNLNKLVKFRGNKKYPLIDIKATILEDNLDDLPEIYKLAKHYKADFFTPAFLKESDLQQNSKLRECFGEEFYKTQYPIKPYFNLEHFEEVYKKLAELSKDGPVIRFYPKFKQNNELKQIKKFYTEAIHKEVGDIYEQCLYPWANILITPQGNVYPCLSYKIGNVKNASIKEVWNNEKFAEFRRKLKKHGVFNACQACCQLKVKD
ncbi:MAG TPA: radical SAM protein [Candidatus Gastranaerophilales bacterium]|nr:radical SAM protein [Candidatus Gastranaerophilales bacterium]